MSHSGSQSGQYHPPRGGEAEMGGWGAIGVSVNKTLNDQMS